MKFKVAAYGEAFAEVVVEGGDSAEARIIGMQEIRNRFEKTKIVPGDELVSLGDFVWEFTEEVGE